MTTNSTLNLGTMQETIEDTIKSARQLGRKGVMAYIGFLGMAYDVAADIAAKDGATWFTKAEKRGERIEKEMAQRVTKLQKQAMNEVETLRESLEQRVENLTGEGNSVVEKLQVGLQKFLRKDGASQVVQEIEVAAIKTVEEVGAEVEKITQQAADSTRKTVKTGTQKVEQVAEAVIDMVESLELPFEAYDKLAWNQIVSKVGTLEEDALIKMREFEMTHRKRPSILKAIEAKLEAMAA